MIDLNTNADEHLLLCEVMGQNYALDASAVVELLSLRDIRVTPLPNMPKHVEGVINLRGNSLVIMDVRSLIGRKSMRQETEDILQMLREREQDHINWIEELCRSVQESREFSLATDPHQCKFGKWYDSLMGDPEALNRFANDQLALLQLLADFDKPHQRIHGVAQRVSKFMSNSDVESAMRLIEETRDTDLRELLELFEKTREMITRIRTGVVVVIESPERRLGLLCDNASEVRQFSSAEHKTSDMVNGAGQFIDSFIEDEETGGLIQVISLAAISG